MLIVGLIAFGCGVLVGYVSLRSLGWLVVLFCLSLDFDASAITLITIRVTNSGSSSNQFQAYTYAGPGCTGSVAGHSVISIGAGATADIFSDYVQTGSGWKVKYGSTFQCESSCQDAVAGVDSITLNGDNCTEGNPSTYYTSVCWTNKSNFPARAAVSYSDGVRETSGLLPPGGVWCASRTNTTFFQWQLCDVIFADGQQLVNCGGVQNPGTNSYPGYGGSGQGGYVGGGVAPNNPIGSGAGAGSTNPVTGGQFANGTSNIINQIYGSGNAQQAQLQQLGNMMQSNNAMQAVMLDDYGRMIDTNGQLVQVTLSGNSNVVHEVKTGNSNVVNKVEQTGSNTVAAVNTQGTNVANASSTAGSNIVNQLSLMSTNPGSGSGYDSNLTAYARAISNNTFWTSNYLFQPGVITNHGLTPGDVAGEGRTSIASNYMDSVRGAWLTVFNTNGPTLLGESTNVASAAGDASIWELPIRTNAVGGGFLVLRVRETAFYTGIIPWVRAVAMFWLTWMAISFMNYRIQEEAMRLGWVPGGSPLQDWKDWWFGVIVVSTVMAALPIVLAEAVGFVLGLGSTVNPLSEAGIAVAGPYQASLYEGLAILYDVFPLGFALALVVYLWVFEQTCTAVVIGGQRIIRFFGR